jgi:hypothetical protein
LRKSRKAYSAGLNNHSHGPTPGGEYNEGRAAKNGIRSDTVFSDKQIKDLTAIGKLQAQRMHDDLARGNDRRVIALPKPHNFTPVSFGWPGFFHL